MAFRELYKTKMCNLFVRGHCPRASCTFAHGDEELRRTAFNGDRYSGPRGKDFRDRADRFGPRRSPDRDYRRSDSRRSPPRIRGRSRSLSPPKRKSHSLSPERAWRPSSERNENRENRDSKRMRREGSIQRSGDVSGGEKDKEPARDSLERPSSKRPSGSRVEIGELELERKLLQEDVEDLIGHKKQLEEKLERRSKETKNLAHRITELESLLQGTEEDNQSLLSKLKKLIKAQQRVARAQDELKKFQSKLYKLVEEMPADDGGEPLSSRLHHAGNAKEATRLAALTGSEPAKNSRGEGAAAPLPLLEQMEEGKPARLDEVVMDLNKGPPEEGAKEGSCRPERAPARSYRRQSAPEDSDDELDRERTEPEEDDKEDELARGGGQVSGDRAALLRELGLADEEPEKERGVSKAENGFAGMSRFEKTEGAAAAHTLDRPVKVEDGLEPAGEGEKGEGSECAPHRDAAKRAGGEDDDVDVEGMMDEDGIRIK